MAWRPSYRRVAVKYYDQSIIMASYAGTEKYAFKEVLTDRTAHGK